MNVLVGNLTPFTIWKVGGGLVGACRTVDDATGIVRDLKRDFPSNDYQVTGPGQGDELEVYHDSRTTSAIPVNSSRHDCSTPEAKS